VGKTRYFRAKCVNITPQMALTAAAAFKQVVVLSATCFHVEVEQFSACLGVARVCQRQLDFLSCITQFYQFMSFLEILKLIHFGLCNQYQIPKFR